MSLLGLYDFDSTILDAEHFLLPDSIDRDDILPDLLATAADFEILYPDPDAFKIIMKSWSSHKLPVWERIAAAAALEYNPIENYDRQETWTDTGTGSSSQQLQSEILHKEAGYNPGIPPKMVDQTKDNRTDGQQASTTGSSTHTGRTHGNIGVTTSQQMLEQELAVAAKLDLYNIIINDVIHRFCIPLY